jgi:2-keto-4-pentenoate hydratase/2-oxohepta-3-ene-1,7-dioic acid hydratase in catechol pathway
VRFGEVGRESPGALDREGRVRDLSGLVTDWSGDWLGALGSKELSPERIAAFPAVPTEVRLGPCVAGTTNFLAVGLNYRDHAAEAGMAIPAEPVLFNKAPSCIAGPNDPLVVPDGATKIDWEVELALVIGRRGISIAESEAMRHVAGVCICTDISERAWQLSGSGQWVKGKSAPGFGPIGPWLVTLDEIPDIRSLTLELSVNGQLMQRGNTGDMIAGPAELVSLVSRYMALEPGDIITTGTPAGVGMGMRPPRYLSVGDRIESRVDGLGAQFIQVTGGHSPTETARS